MLAWPGEGRLGPGMEPELGADGGRTGLGVKIQPSSSSFGGTPQAGSAYLPPIQEPEQKEVKRRSGWGWQPCS